MVLSPLYTVLQAGLRSHAARGGWVAALVSISLLPGAPQPPRIGAEGFPSTKAALGPKSLLLNAYRKVLSNVSISGRFQNKRTLDGLNFSK